MTKEQLYRQLLDYKNQYGVTPEIYQRYLWALETLSKTATTPSKLNNAESTAK